ncbi:MAG: hypothetical protein MRJ96_08510 [Nitrospirales bacterium]|nr:hypothetical protein [Nitrospira sp.]MDR4501475.1 hypothetical protein [Nitrospirales bacterium]
MAIVDEIEVRSILTSERETKINRSYKMAWIDWWSSDKRQELSRWPRTRANNLFEYLSNHLIDEFSDDPEARFIFERETFKLIIQERLVIRFKKSNSHGVGSNISTQTEMDFRDLETDLPGFPGVQKVEIVYTLNATASAIAEITVLARNGDRRLWSYAITESGEATVIPITQSQLPPLDNDIDKMVQPRKTNKQVNEDSK